MLKLFRSSPFILDKGRINSSLYLDADENPLWNMKEPDNSWYNPNHMQQVETLKTAIMLAGTVKPLPVEYNSCIMHVVEDYHMKSNEVESLKKDLKTAVRERNVMVDELQRKTLEWEKAESDYQEELKRLRAKLLDEDHDIEYLPVSRSNRVICEKEKVVESDEENEIENKKPGYFYKDGQRQAMILATTPGIQDARTNRRFLMTDSPYNFFMGIDPSPSPPVRRPFFEISVVDDAQEHNTECPTLKVVPATPPLETDRSTITEGLEELHRQKHTSAIGKIAKTGKKNARRIFHSTSSPKLPKSSMKNKGQTEKENRGSDDTPNPKKNRKVKFQLGSLDNQSTLSQDTQDTVTTSSPKEKKSSEEPPFPHSGALDVKFESLGRHSTTSQVSQGPIKTFSTKSKTRSGSDPLPHKARMAKFTFGSLGRKSKPSQVSRDFSSTAAPDDAEGKTLVPPPRMEPQFQPSPKRIGIETALAAAEGAAKKREPRHVVNEDYWTKEADEYY